VKCWPGNPVMSYFGQFKNWLGDMYPAQGVMADNKLRKIGSTLSSYCTKRPNELPGKQAPPCTKAEFKIIVSSRFEDASTSSDNLDAALVTMMWRRLAPRYLISAASMASFASVQLRSSRRCLEQQLDS